MSYIDAYNILSKVWLDSKDIQKLLSCGIDSARKTRKEISQIIKSKGYELPLCKNKKVLTKEVIDYLGIDMDYITQMAKLEQKVG